MENKKNKIEFYDRSGCFDICLEEHLASLSPLLDLEKDLQTLAETSCSLSALLQVISKHDGSSGKTSPVSCRLQRRDFGAFLGMLEELGYGLPTGF